MVAITVILAAVIGTFVLGLGDSISDSAPQAQLNVDSTDFSASNGTATIVHNGGDELQGEDLRVTFNGTNGANPFSGSFGVGESREIDNANLNDGTRLRIIHVPSDSIIFDQTV